MCAGPGALPLAGPGLEASGQSPGLPSLTLLRLHLTQFRSYERLSWRPAARLSVITGPNGSGKTNLLEAVSLLAPGRGLRGARMSELARHGGDGRWGVAARIAAPSGEVELGTGAAPDPASDRRGEGGREHPAPQRALEQRDGGPLAEALDLDGGKVRHGSRSHAHERGQVRPRRLNTQEIPQSPDGGGRERLLRDEESAGASRGLLLHFADIPAHVALQPHGDDDAHRELGVATHGRQDQDALGVWVARRRTARGAHLRHRGHRRLRRPALHP